MPGRPYFPTVLLEYGDSQQGTGFGLQYERELTSLPPNQAPLTEVVRFAVSVAEGRGLMASATNLDIDGSAAILGHGSQFPMLLLKLHKREEVWSLPQSSGLT